MLKPSHRPLPMARLLQSISTTPTLPRVPDVDTSGKFSGLLKAVFDLHKWAAKLNGFLQQYLNQLAQSNNNGLATFGVNLASASSIRIKDTLHHVTGNAAISTINSPPNILSQPIVLVADGNWTLVTGGNIAANVAPAIGTIVILAYDIGTQLWYPISGSGAGPVSPFFTVLIESISASPFSVPSGNITLLASASAGADFTALLPPATGTGFIVIVKKMDANAHNVIVDGNGGTIDGLPTYTLTTQYSTIGLMDVGLNTWIRLFALVT